MSVARTVCRIIAAGALLSGAIMVFFAKDVEATTNTTLVDSIVHISNVKFMAAMWCVVGVIFAIGAAELHHEPAWRLLRLACIGISVGAVVRLVEMVRLDRFSSYGMIAAVIELIVPASLIYLRGREFQGVSP